MNEVAKPNIRFFFTLLTALVVLFCYVDAKGSYEKLQLNPDVYSEGDLKRIIDDYHTQVKVLDRQILDVQKDLDWLVSKINRISDSGRKVSNQLNSSVSSKKKKVSRLKKQRTRLKLIIAKFENAYNAKNLQMEKKNSKTSVETVKVSPSVKKIPNESAVPDKLSEIEAAIKEAGLEDWVEVLIDGGCAKVNNALPILFSSGSASLAKEYKSFLKKLAHFLKPYDVRVYVNGFADSDPIQTKRYPSNLELGASRAANVVHEMVNSGLRPEVFKIGTAGEYHFAAKKPSPKKSFQRRAQVTVIFSG